MRVLIVGRGVAGLALAAKLARQEASGGAGGDLPIRDSARALACRGTVRCLSACAARALCAVQRGRSGGMVASAPAGASSMSIGVQTVADRSSVASARCASRFAGWPDTQPGRGRAAPADRGDEPARITAGDALTMAELGRRYLANLELEVPLGTMSTAPTPGAQAPVHRGFTGIAFL